MPRHRRFTILPVSAGVARLILRAADLVWRLGGFVENRHEQYRLTMGTQDEQPVQRAISIIAQSDPLIKLVQQVRLGRLKSTDTGVRAVTESWLETYGKALATDGLTQSCLRRLNPAPRLAVLIDIGVLADNHPGVESLTAAYDRAVACAPSD